MSDEHYKVLHREERRPQIVERIQYNEVRHERVGRREREERDCCSGVQIGSYNEVRWERLVLI